MKAISALFQPLFQPISALLPFSGGMEALLTASHGKLLKLLKRGSADGEPAAERFTWQHLAGGGEKFIELLTII